MWGFPLELSTTYRHDTLVTASKESISTKRTSIPTTALVAERTHYDYDTKAGR